MSSPRWRWGPRRRWRQSVVALVGLVLLGACASSTPPAPLPPSPVIVSVTMDEYSYAHRPHIKAGRVVFRLRNAGQVRHELLLVRLPDDLEGTLDEQLRSSARRPVTTLSALAAEPGDAGIFAADLAPGRYGFLCFLDDGDGTTHALKGMSSDLFVGGRGEMDAPRRSP